MITSLSIAFGALIRMTTERCVMGARLGIVRVWGVLMIRVWKVECWVKALAEGRDASGTVLD